MIYCHSSFLSFGSLWAYIIVQIILQPLALWRIQVINWSLVCITMKDHWLESRISRILLFVLSLALCEYLHFLSSLSVKSWILLLNSLFSTNPKKEYLVELIMSLISFCLVGELRPLTFHTRNDIKQLGDCHHQLLGRWWGPSSFVSSLSSFCF